MESDIMRRLRAHLLLPALIMALESAACASGPSESELWNGAFEHKAGFGWSGGDGAYSVPLPNARTLWLFGDSYLSDVKATGRTDGTLRFGSTIAIENGPLGLLPPAAADLEFDWGPPNSNGWLPVGWDVMQGPEAPASVATARAAGLGLLAWPLHGMTIGNDLVLFTLPVSPFKCDDCQGPAIKVHGSVASIVRGVDRPYSEWGFRHEQGWDPAQRPPQRFVPHSRATAAVDDPTWLFWGNYMMRDPADSTAVLVYGHRRHAEDNATVVARVPDVAAADDVWAFDRWTFWNGTAWGSDPDEAVSVATDSATETSVLAVPSSYGGGFAMVESNHPFSIEVKVSLAENPWGPFVEKYVMSLGDCPITGFDASRDITYAAKAHPELSTDDSLLVSLIVVPRPGTNQEMVVSDPHMYVPRFVDLPWAEVFGYDHSSKERCQ
jgi:hypothetical protein